MPTNKERREVAAKLREKHGEQLGMFVPQSLSMQALNTVEDLLDCIPVKRTLLLDLADLIEPEEERTCTFSIVKGDISRPICSACGYEADGYECDYWTENGVSFWEYSRNFCDGCGAKVVEE